MIKIDDVPTETETRNFQFSNYFKFVIISRDLTANDHKQQRHNAMPVV